MRPPLGRWFIPHEMRKAAPGLDAVVTLLRNDNDPSESFAAAGGGSRRQE